MLEIASQNGKWNDNDWHLLCRDNCEEYIFYAPTLRIALSLSKTLAESIHSTGGLPESITSRLIRNSKTQVFPLVERPKAAFYLAIGLTNNCTLACDYCHAEADRDTAINHDLITKSIDYAFEKAAETPKRTLSVSFAVGGEPTMNWKDFTYTVNRIRELEKAHDGVDKVYLSMTTNCYYGAEKREFVANNFDALTLSIDGFQEIQDFHRPTSANKGSYSWCQKHANFLLIIKK